MATASRWRSTTGASSTLGTTVYVGMFSSTIDNPNLLTTSMFSNVSVRPSQPQGADLKVTIVPHPVSRETFASTSADVTSGCVTAGTHSVVRFDTLVENVGRSALALGDPAQRPDLFKSAKLVGFEDVGFWSDDTEVLIKSRKVPFCFEDTSASQPWAGTTKTFTCSNQGISPGWTSKYPSTRTCAYFVVDTVVTGNYSIQMQINRDRAVLEDDYTNDYAAPVFPIQR
jgi:hypothetical protein